MHVSLDNGTVKHLSEFIVESVKSNMITLKADIGLRLPALRVEGYYLLAGYIPSLQLPLTGDGQF